VKSTTIKQKSRSIFAKICLSQKLTITQKENYFSKLKNARNFKLISPNQIF